MADNKKTGLLRPASSAKMAEWDKAKANKGSEGPKKSEPRMGKYGVIRPAGGPSAAEKRAKELSAAQRAAKKKAAIKKAAAEGPKKRTPVKKAAKKK